MGVWACTYSNDICAFMSLSTSCSCPVPAASLSAPGCHAGVYETPAGAEESKETVCVLCEAGEEWRAVREGGREGVFQ